MHSPSNSLFSDLLIFLGYTCCSMGCRLSIASDDHLLLLCLVQNLDRAILLSSLLNWCKLSGICLILTRTLLVCMGVGRFVFSAISLLQVGQCWLCCMCVARHRLQNRRSASDRRVPAGRTHSWALPQDAAWTFCCCFSGRRLLRSSQEWKCSNGAAPLETDSAGFSLERLKFPWTG